MKIGILTFWWSQDNYGQLLQAYALQKYLRDAGHDAFLIRYDSENDIIRTPLLFRICKAMNPIKLWKFIARKIRIMKSRKEMSAFPRHFDDFRLKYIVQSERFYNSYEQLKENPPEADCYIVGSDQVWNFRKMKAKRILNNIHAYFLDFGDGTVRRISYAASWGKSDVPATIRNEIEPLIKRFDFIAVREKSGVDVCRSFGVDAEWVCDPTLLLDAVVYRNIYKENQIRRPKNKYVLLYMLNNEFDFDISTVYSFAKERKLEVVYVTGNGVIDQREKCFATIPEWLYLVDNAEYVITNSFHCCVFSILFGKRFGAIRLSGENSGMNERLSSLFDMTGYGERYIADGDFSALESPFVVNGDFALRRKSREILKRILETKKW